MSDYLVGKKIQFIVKDTMYENGEKLFTGTVQGFFCLEPYKYNILLLNENNKFYDIPITSVKDLKILDNISSIKKTENKFKLLDIKEFGENNNG